MRSQSWIAAPPAKREFLTRERSNRTEPDWLVVRQRGIGSIAMSPTPRKRFPLGWCILVFLTIVLAPLGLQYLGFFPWSNINRWSEYVDIHSARFRYTRDFLGFRVSERVVDSELTRMLLPGDLHVVAIWKCVNTFSPGVNHSPHYQYHGAISQMRELQLAWRSREFTPSEKRESVLRLLHAWQQGRGTYGADIILRSPSTPDPPTPAD
jgi:hypothetical protein